MRHSECAESAGSAAARAGCCRLFGKKRRPLEVPVPTPWQRGQTLEEPDGIQQFRARAAARHHGRDRGRARRWRGERGPSVHRRLGEPQHYVHPHCDHVVDRDSRSGIEFRAIEHEAIGQPGARVDGYSPLHAHERLEERRHEQFLASRPPLFRGRQEAADTRDPASPGAGSRGCSADGRSARRAAGGWSRTCQGACRCYGHGHASVTHPTGLTGAGIAPAAEWLAAWAVGASLKKSLFEP